MKSPRRFRALIALMLVLTMLAGCGAKQDPQTSASAGAQSAIPNAGTAMLSMDTLLPTAAAAFVYDLSTDTLLYEKQSSAPMRPGDLSFLVAAMAVIDDGDLQKKVTVVDSYDPAGSAANIKLRKGEVLTREQLLYGMLMEGAHDALDALTESVGGEEQMLAAMNDKVKAMGLKNTCFGAPAGDDVFSMTTAREVAVIFDAVIRDYPVILDALSRSGYAIAEDAARSGRSLSSVNNLLMNSDIRPALTRGEVNACLAGYQMDLDSADLVCRADINDMDVICVIIGAHRSFSPNGWSVEYFGNFEEADAIIDELKAACRAENGVVVRLDPAQSKESTPVSDVNELIAAIGPNANLKLAAGTYDLTAAKTYGRATGNAYCRWDDVGDGFELVISGVDGMVLSGADKTDTSVVTSPRMADVIKLENTANVTIRNLTFGHTRGQDMCLGGVIALVGCTDTNITDCGLYGCGIVGVSADECTRIDIDECEIYECSQGGVRFNGCSSIRIFDCDFHHIGTEQNYAAWTVVEAYNCDAVSVLTCNIRQNRTDSLLQASGCGELFFLSNQVSDNDFAATMLGSFDTRMYVDGCDFRNNRCAAVLSDYAVAMDRYGNLLTAEDILAMAYGTEVSVETPAVLEVPEGGEVRVTTAAEFLQAIGPNRTIILDGKIDLTAAADYGSFTGGVYYSWQQVYDGYELNINNVDMLTILGAGPDATQIITAPRYANVLCFRNCSGISLEGFTAGHSAAPGSCSGGVVHFENCSEIGLGNLGLFGCGTVGVSTNGCQNVSISDCNIYDCSENGLELYNTANCYVVNTIIRNIGNEYGYGTGLTLCSCRYVTVEQCSFSEIRGTSLVYNSGSVDTRLLSDTIAGCTVVTMIDNEGPASTVDGCSFGINQVSGNYLTGTAPVNRKGEALTEQDLKNMTFESDITVTSGGSESARKEVKVSDVDAFLAAIGSNTTIILEGKDFDLSKAANYGGNSFGSYYWEDTYEGYGLVISGVNNLTICSADGDRAGHTIAAVPRYANVLSFRGCSDVTLSGFTAGHTIEPGSCTGGVLDFDNCTNLRIENCGLYGCGILGISARYCDNLIAENCEIYECSYGGVQMDCVSLAEFNGCVFRDLGGEDITLSRCSGVTRDGELVGNG